MSIGRWLLRHLDNGSAYWVLLRYRSGYGGLRTSQTLLTDLESTQQCGDRNVPEAEPSEPTGQTKVVKKCIPIVSAPSA